MPVEMILSTRSFSTPKVSLHSAKKSFDGDNGAKFTTSLKPLEVAASAKVSKEHDAYVQLEAVFLRNFVEAMLPKDDSGLVETGIAGEYWRSMLADQISTVVAVTGKMGIADALRHRSIAAHASGE